MDSIIEKMYNEITCEDFVLTGKGRRKFDEVTEKWKEITEKLADEEKNQFSSLYYLTYELINICCMDHFAKGYKIGARMSFELTDTLDSILK